MDPSKMTPHMAMQVGMENGEMYQVKKPNTLPTWGNTTTMNLNPLIHTNVENSPYYNGRLQELKTYHELVDEIYYKVKHLEPWEKGSRNAGGRRQTGMCGGVRGVGVGGIVSSAFCILYRLYNLKLTRKQVYGLMKHTDSPFIRGIGFLYVRFSQPPHDFWEWFEPYIDDPEEVDVRAGGGQFMTMGEIVRHLITKQDWFSTLFPRIPVPIQIQIDKKLAALRHATSVDPNPKPASAAGAAFVMEEQEQEDNGRQEPSRSSHRDRKPRSRSPGRGRDGRRHRSRSRSRSNSSSERKKRRSRSRSPKRRSRSCSKSDSRSPRRKSRSRTPKRKRNKRSRSRDKHRHRRDKDRGRR